VNVNCKSPLPDLGVTAGLVEADLIAVIREEAVKVFSIELGVWVFALRVLLRGVPSGGGALCPSGISCFKVNYLLFFFGDINYFIINDYLQGSGRHSSL
jgi:hypothetical protein